MPFFILPAALYHALYHCIYHMCLTLQVVQHIGEKFVGAIGLTIQCQDLLSKWISLQTQYMELEQLSQFVWENTKMIVVQMEFPINNITKSEI
jgi:hypothetical protein